MNKQFILLVIFHCFQPSDMLASSQSKKITHNPYIVSNNRQQCVSEKKFNETSGTSFSLVCNHQDGNTHSDKEIPLYSYGHKKYFLHQARVVSGKNYQGNQSNCSSYNQQRSNWQVQKNQENDDDQQVLAQGYQSSYPSYEQHCNASNSNNYNQQALVNYGYQGYQSSYSSYNQQRSNYQGSLDSRSVLNDKLSYSFFKCKTKDEIKSLIEQMSVEELDSPITNNFESIGHILLRRRDRENFKLWLERGASCSAISGNQEKNPYFNNVSILHLLCIKGLDEFPNVLDLIKEVLRRNPSLLRIENGQRKRADYLIISNNKVNDEVTLEIINNFLEYLDESELFYDRNLLNELSKIKPKTILRLSSIVRLSKILLLPKNKQERIDFISKLAAEDLDKPFLHNNGSIGQVLLNDNDIESFQAWFARGALCTSVQDKNGKTGESKETVLSCLCIKGLDKVPNLVDLIIKVLDRNPKLLFIRLKKVSVANLILNNKNIDDETTLKILQEFVFRGFDFMKDSIIYNKYSNNNYNDMEDFKPKTIDYIKDYFVSLSMISNFHGIQKNQ